MDYFIFLDLSMLSSEDSEENGWVSIRGIIAEELPCLTTDSESSPNIDEYSRRIKSQKPSPSDKKRNTYGNQWIDTRRKMLVNSGQSYVSRNGTFRSHRQMGPACPTTCRHMCSTKFNIHIRKNIHREFWKLSDHCKQWEYINKYIERGNVKQYSTGGPSRRKYTIKYFLPMTAEDDPLSYKRVQVCLKFFINTLSISYKVIRTAISKLDSEGVILTDNRGRHVRSCFKSMKP